MRIFRLLLVVSLLLASACSASPEKPDPSETIQHSELNIDGHERLTDDVVPKSYSLDITIDPRSPNFSGTTEIDVAIARPLRVIYLHAEDLEISKATLARKGEKPILLEVVVGENGGIALITPRKVEGDATLAFEYRGPLDKVPTGLYRVEDGEDWYAFTQFEPLEARSAFPSFDEPIFKTPFSTTMRVPTGMFAATNGPETGRATEGQYDVYSFATTRPIPTYLVAFAVGNFDIVEAEADAIPNVPFRVLTTRGNGHLAQYMLEQTPAILERLTTYFGQSYPYQKLDVVAVPNFAAGAMENVGLVTFRERLLLIDPETASVSDKRAALSVMAHELAHMWFGNLVTLGWWDELWLNESFATWMASKVLGEMRPELESDVDRVRGTRSIVRSDSLVQSRAIRQPIEHGGDVYNAFDGITYGKGARVLAMFETWLGEEVFRTGVREYVEMNPHGTGTTEELLGALDKAASKPVGETMKPFLDRPGVPLLAMELDCDGEKPTVAVSQSRYLPAGSKASTESDWSVPVCIRFASGDEGTHCTLVEGATASFELPTDRCPAFIYPNANESGYYRWNLPDDAIVALAEKHRKKLSVTERVGLLANLDNLLAAESLDVATHAEVLEAMSREEHRTIVALVLDALYGYEDAVPEEKEEAFARWVRSLIKRHADRVGYEPKEGEPVEAALLRPRLISAMVRLGKSSDYEEKADASTTQFMKKMDSVSAEIARTALPITARDGDSSLWLSYKLAIDSAPTPAARAAVLSGLGNFRDPQLVSRSLDLILNGTVRSQDFWRIVGGTMGEPETHAVTWDWLTANYDAIVGVIGAKSAPSLPWIGRGFCSEEGAQKVEAFFSDPARLQAGTKRRLSQATESIRQCARFRDYASAGLAETL